MPRETLTTSSSSRRAGRRTRTRAPGGQRLRHVGSGNRDLSAGHAAGSARHAAGSVPQSISGALPATAITSAARTGLGLADSHGLSRLQPKCLFLSELE